MSRESEKVLAEMKKYLEETSSEGMSIEELNGLLGQFTKEYTNNRHEKVTERTAKTADDYLALAEETTEKKKAEQYIQKALELEPDNLDAIGASLDLSDDTNLEYYQKLSEAVRTGSELMEKKGLMDEDSIGDFWGILETRPYMRLLERRAEFLIEAGMMGQAVKECEEMIRLSNNDNLGIRFRLMHLYAFLEKEEPALELHKKYDDHDETMMLLPLSVLFFKTGDLVKAEDYLRRLKNINKDTKRFFRAIQREKLDRYMDGLRDFGYRPFTIEELIVDLMENSFLFSTTPIYLEWAYEKTSNM